MDTPDPTPATPSGAGPVTAPQAPPAVAPRAAAPAPRPAAAKPAAPASGPRRLSTGRRKESIARVSLAPGNGVIVVNAKPYETYFCRETLQLAIRQPLVVTHQLGKYDVVASVEGGGLTGQAGAVRLGIARALLELDAAHRTILRSAGLLTRDPRMKERKKYGQKGARKRFQWTKR